MRFLLIYSSVFFLKIPLRLVALAVIGVWPLVESLNKSGGSSSNPVSIFPPAPAGRPCGRGHRPPPTGWPPRWKGARRRRCASPWARPAPRPSPSSGQAAFFSWDGAWGGNGSHLTSKNAWQIFYGQKTIQTECEAAPPTGLSGSLMPGPRARRGPRVRVRRPLPRPPRPWAPRQEVGGATAYFSQDTLSPPTFFIGFPSFYALGCGC